MAKPGSIPVVDLSAFHRQSSDRAQHDAAGKLFDACQRFGAVQIIGHGVDPEVLREAFTWSKRLYDLPHEDKMRAPHPVGQMPHRGYSHPGLEKAYSKTEAESHAARETNGESLRQIQDYKESFEIGSESNSHQPNIWLPEEILPGFRSFMTSFYWQLHETACLILKIFGIALNLTAAETDHILRLHSGENNQLRLLHYPSVETEKLEREELARLPAHCDWCTLTILFQDQIGGLEFEDPQDLGRFLLADPTPGAVVLNAGDMFQRLSNDSIPSTNHRVTMPPRSTHMSPTISEERFSIPYFVAPDGDEVISCLPSCVSQEKPAKFDPVSINEYGANISKYQYRRTGPNLETKKETVES